MSRDLLVQVDPEGHSIYIYLKAIKAGGVARTERVGDGILADFGPRGDLLGVELLGPKAVTRLFAAVVRKGRFRSLRELAPKKDLLRRLIA